jgi:hypothetical protein
MSEPQESHLSQQVEQIADILKDLAVFVAKADFGEAENGVYTCRDKGLREACEALFEALGFDGRVIISAVRFKMNVNVE